MLFEVLALRHRVAAIDQVIQPLSSFFLLRVFIVEDEFVVWVADQVFVPVAVTEEAGEDSPDAV